MAESIKARLAGMGANRDKSEIRRLLEAIRTDLAYLTDRMKSQMLATAGLVITGGSKLVPKTGASVAYAIANGVLVSIAAATDMTALAGSVTNAKFNIFVFYIDSAGTLTTSMGTEGATLAAVVPPSTPANKAVVGILIINPTGTGAFVGGTTALDDATVVPNAKYISPVGAFDPTTALGLTA